MVTLASHIRPTFSYITQNTHDDEDIESRFWESYLGPKKGTPPFAAQPPIEVVAVGVHSLASLHVTSVEFLVTSMVRMAESCERAVQRVEMVYQGLMKG